MPTKEPRRVKATRQQTLKPAIEKTDAPELADDDLKTVSGGLSSAFGSTLGAADTSSCISQL